MTENMNEEWVCLLWFGVWSWVLASPLWHLCQSASIWQYQTVNSLQCRSFTPYDLMLLHIYVGYIWEDVLQIAACRDISKGSCYITTSFYTCSLPVFTSCRYLCIDVIGVCKSAEDISRITTKTSREVSKRTLNLMDTSGKVVAVTLWGEEVTIKPSLSVCLRSVSTFSLEPATDFQLNTESWSSRQ